MFTAARQESGVPRRTHHRPASPCDATSWSSSPATAFSWATVASNPSLTEVHRRTGRAVVGGLPAKPEIGSLRPKEIEARGRRAIAEMGGRYLLLGPDCSINPDTPEEVMDAATAATR